MKVVRQQLAPPPLPTTTSILLAELRKECARVAGLIIIVYDKAILWTEMGKAVFSLKSPSFVHILAIISLFLVRR